MKFREESARRTRGTLLAVTLGLLAGAPARGLDPSKQITQYDRRQWTSDDGLPQGPVQALRQTRDGYLWIGTQEGLARFDGARFTVFDKRNTPAIRIPDVTSLAEDSGGTLWIGTHGGGLASYQKGRFAALGKGEGLPSAFVEELEPDLAGGVLVHTAGGGLTRVRDGRPVALGGGEPWTERVASIGPGRRAVWIATEAGRLIRWTPEAREIVAQRSELAGTVVESLLEDRDGVLWIATDGGGLCRLRGGDFACQGIPGSGIRRVLSVATDREGSLWAGTYGAGLLRRREEAAAVLTDRGGLVSNFVRSLLEDREGNLWIGSDGGLQRFRDARLTPFGPPEGLSADLAECVYQDRAGTIWVGSAGGLDRLAGSRAARASRETGVPPEIVFSVGEDRDGRLLVGTAKGLLVRGPGKPRAYTTADGLTRDAILAILTARDGAVWLGTAGGGLNCLRDGRFSAWTRREGLANEVVQALAEDSDGAIWAGTDGGGLLRLDGTRLTVFTEKDGLPSDRVLSLHADEDGTLWIGTGGGGLARRRNGRFRSYGTKDGLFDDLVFAIVDDGAGRLWMSSNKGIFSVSRREIEDLDRGAGRVIHSEVYGRHDGARSAECNGGSQPAGLRDASGRLWFPTVQGVVAIDPVRREVAGAGAPVRVEAVVTRGAAHDPAQGPIRLAPEEDDLEIQYTAPILSSPERIRFRYRLEGVDDGWVEAGTRRVAYYTNVPPGDYGFQVYASNPDGAWTPLPARLDFTRRPFFYQTRAFLLLALAAGALLLGGVYRLRVRRMKHREEVLQRRVEAAVAQVKVLGGLLPICASCKKIRDDRGYWNQIESYIRDHSQAEFSHGICPECVSRLYPDVVGVADTETPTR